MRLRESEIEETTGKEAGRWAKSIGIPLLYLKLNILGRKGFPDRMVLGRPAKILFMEFKQPGEKARPLQKYVHTLLRSLGFRVEVHDNVTEAVEAIKAYFRPKGCTDGGYKENIGEQRREGVSEAWEGEDLSSPKSFSDTKER